MTSYQFYIAVPHLRKFLCDIKIKLKSVKHGRAISSTNEFQISNPLFWQFSYTLSKWRGGARLDGKIQEPRCLNLQRGSRWSEKIHALEILFSCISSVEKIFTEENRGDLIFRQNDVLAGLFFQSSVKKNLLTASLGQGIFIDFAADFLLYHCFSTPC